MHWHVSCALPHQAANKTKHQVSAKIAIAAVYYMENEDDNALRDYREALNLSEQFGYKDFQVYCLRCLIGILSNKGVTNALRYDSVAF